MSQTKEARTGNGLVRKLVQVLREIEAIPKNGRNAFHGYDYATEMDILQSIRPKLAEQNVFVFTSVDSGEIKSHLVSRRTEPSGAVVEKYDHLTEIRTLHTFVDGDTGETFVVHGLGQGVDAGDKGGYKALTGAMKYFLLKNFLVPTGDDPERDDHLPSHRDSKAQDSARRPGGERAAQRFQSAPATPAPATRAPAAATAEKPVADKAGGEKAETSETPARKAPPTKTQVIEFFGSAANAAVLQSAYAQAFKYAWNLTDAQEISDRFLARFAQLNDYQLAEDRFTDAAGQPRAEVIRNSETGFVQIRLVPVNSPTGRSEQKSSGAKAKRNGLQAA